MHDWPMHDWPMHDWPMHDWPMYDWTVLNRAVSAALTAGRVGTPVFVRWTAVAAQSRQELKPLLAEMCEFSSHWIASTPRQLYASGTETLGHLSASLEFANGGSALLAIALAHGRPHADLALYGSDGAIYHTGPPALPPAPADFSQPDSRAAIEALAALEKSLRANQPVLLPAKGGL